MIAAGLMAGLIAAVPAAGRSGSISRARADAIALRALGTKDLAGNVALLGSPSPLPAGDVVGAWSMVRPMATVRLAHPAWLFWEDLEYGAEFAHPSQLLLLDSATGRILAHMYLTMWPLVNGVAPSLVPTMPGGAAPRFVVYSSVPGASAAAADDVAWTLPAQAAADNITAADLSKDCLITIGDRRLKQGFNPNFKAIGEWAGTGAGKKLDRARADPSPTGLEKAVFEFLQKGCTDFLIYVAGHGRYPKGGKVDGVPDHYGQFAPPPGDYPGFDTPGIGLAAQEASAEEPEGPITSFLTPADVSHLIDEFTKPGKVTIDGVEHELKAEQVKNVKFKLKLQTCYAGWFAQVLLKDRGIKPGEKKADPLVLVETSSSATEASWGYLPHAFVLVDGKEVTEDNPRTVANGEQGVSEATYANVYGLTAWAQNPTGGRTLVDGLQQAFQAGASQDFTRQIGWTHPQLLGPDLNLGDPDPTTATTPLTTHVLPTRTQGPPPANYTCVGPVNMGLFDNWNGGAVGNGGTPKTYNTGGQHYCVVSINDYHWNNGLGAHPGTIALRTANGTLGPYRAVGSTGSPSQAFPNGVPDANWTATPTHQVVIDGAFTCIDSDPATWSANPASGGAGFCKVYVQLAQPAG